MGPQADLPSDAEPVEPAPKQARKAAEKGAEAESPAPGKKAAARKTAPKKTAAKKAPAAGAPAKKDPVAKTAARKAPAKKAAPAQTPPPTAAPEPERAAATDEPETAPATGEPQRAGATVESERAGATEQSETAPADARRGRKRAGRFRRAELRSQPTTSDIPRPARDPRRIQQRVAVIIPAKDEARRIAATVRAAKSIPQVDLVLVVDDGSQDNTQHLAREAGAVVVRHSHNRGKAAAMETGAAVVAMRDTPERPPRLLLFIDADLAETAVNTAPLIPPVAEHAADFSIALLPPQKGAGGRGIVVAAARKGIARLTGWAPTQPLSGMRCLTRAAFEAATPLARGWGVETGMTIDLLRQGFVAVEVPCELRHRPSGNDLVGQMHRAAQYRDVQLAISARTVRGAAAAVRRAVTQKP